MRIDISIRAKRKTENPAVVQSNEAPPILKPCRQPTGQRKGQSINMFLVNLKTIAIASPAMQSPTKPVKLYHPYPK